MFRSKSAVNPLTHCKKHLKHRQSPGVCSLCLADKLSKLSSAGASVAVAVSTASSNASSSYLSSSDASSCGSSCASPPRGRSEAKKKEKSRFWSKLLSGARTKKSDFHGRSLAYHSEPLPVTAAAVLAN